MPHILLGIIAAAAVGLCAADVSHVVAARGGGAHVNEAAAAINLLAHAEQPADTFWWMDRDSALGRAAADYQHGAASDKSHAFAANPFLSGRVSVSDVPPAAHGPQKVDLSTNPFFNGGLYAGGSSSSSSSEPGTECRGDGFICVKRSDCHDGVIHNDGFGLIQVRSQVSLCNPKTEVCCRYKNHDYVTGGKSSVHKAPVLSVTNLGETGADVNRLGAGPGSSTSKPTRDAPFVGSTIDYSNQHFGDEVRFASTIRGPAYLPPVDSTKQPPKTLPPPIEVPRCQGGQQLIGGQCQCVGNLVFQGGRCVPRPTPPPPPPSCQGGQQFIGGQCQCVGNLVFQGGRCVPRPTPPPPPPSCQGGQQFIGGQCQCVGNLVFQGGRCVPPAPTCPSGQQLINGQCQCSGGLIFEGGRCVPRPTPRPTPPAPYCPSGQQLVNGQCQCAGNLILENGHCVPRVVCGYGEQLINGRCVPRATPPPPTTGKPTYLPPGPKCGPNQYEQNGQCFNRPTQPPPTLPPSCSGGQQFINGQCQCSGGLIFQGGRCVPKPPTCGYGEYLVNGQCVARPTPPPPPPTKTCGYGEILQNGRCVTPTPTCPAGQQFINGQCQCSGGLIFQGGRCVPKPPTCGYGEYLVNGQCVARPTPPPPPPTITCGYGELLQNGRCVPKPPTCRPNEYLSNGQCVARPTPPPTVRCNYNEELVNGQCIPKVTPPPSCPSGQQFINGQCQCSGGLIFEGGRCVPRPTPPPAPYCPSGQQYVNGQCQCAGNLILENGRCVPRVVCGYGEQLINGRCVPRATPPPPTTSKPTYLPPGPKCGPNQYEQNGQCFTRPTQPPPTLPPSCTGGQQFINGHCQCAGNLLFQGGRCVPPAPSCPAGQQFINGQCQCSGGLIFQGGRCVPRPPTCGYGESLVNGQCVGRPTPPPPPPTITCGYGELLQNGRCVPKTPTCRHNEYLSNGQCIARPTPPPTPPPVYCQGGQQNVNGVCRCVGNTIFQNGRCITPVTPGETINPCTGNQFLQNGQCISCRSHEVFQNGQCVPRATPPPPATPSAYLPPVTCAYDQILQGGRCVPRPTTSPPVICQGNTYLQNGICVPRPTQPSGPGYHYPTPTPAFIIPEPIPDGNNVEQVYVATSTTTFRPDNQDSGTSNDPTILRPNGPNEPVLPGCAAALKCVQEIYCTAEGFVSPVPVVFTKEQEYSRVPLTDCADQEAGIVGKCCRDADYKDPWPSANLVNGIDNGQYREDPGLGQYSGDVRNNRLTRSNGNVQLQQYQPIQSQPLQCGVRHSDAQPRGPGALDAHFAEIPWQAMILRDSNRSLLCGGAIIRKNAVLTSAHCVEGLEASDVLIKGGEWKLGIDEEPLPFQIVKVKRILVHPHYDRENLQNDVAILVLEEKLRFTKNIGDICLPAPGEQPTGQCIVTGWGKKVLQIHLKDAIMRRIDVNVIPADECRAAMDASFPALSGRVSAQSYCAASKADQCKVDHGSALACTNDGVHYTLHGVFSWDTGCKDERQLGAYIQPDVAWIESALTPKGRRY